MLSNMAIGKLSLKRNCVAARIALAVYLCGFLCFLIGISTPNWLSIENGMQSGLWSVCYYVQDVGWVCDEYSQDSTVHHRYISEQHKAEYIPAAQALAIITLMFYIIQFAIMVTVLVLVLRNVSFGDYWNPRNISLFSSLITFSSVCFTIMTLIVVAIKGRDYVQEVQSDEFTVFTYLQKGIDLTGSYSVGWSFGVEVLSSLITFISFSLFIYEYKLLQSQIPLPTEEALG